MEKWRKEYFLSMIFSKLKNLTVLTGEAKREKCYISNSSSKLRRKITGK
jgi:membrane-anchored glycerophosphoryl diester phosphodiesterase (GDPDase)